MQRAQEIFKNDLPFHSRAGAEVRIDHDDSAEEIDNKGLAEEGGESLLLLAARQQGEGEFLKKLLCNFLATIYSYLNLIVLTFLHLRSRRRDCTNSYY